MSKCCFCGKSGLLFEKVKACFKHYDFYNTECGEKHMCRDCVRMLYKVYPPITMIAPEVAERNRVEKSKISIYSEVRNYFVPLLNSAVDADAKDGINNILKFIDGKINARIDPAKELYEQEKKDVQLAIQEFAKSTKKCFDWGGSFCVVDGKFVYVNKEINKVDFSIYNETNIKKRYENLESKQVFHIIDVFRTPMASILYFKQEGDVQNIAKTTYTAGEGASLMGAAVGGILFGAAGAIIGSQRYKTPGKVDTAIVTSDTRCVKLYYKGEGQTVQSKSFSPDVYQALLDIMPEKEYSRVLAGNNQSKASSGLDELKKLKELLDAGVITKEEFEKKKAQLLGV